MDSDLFALVYVSKAILPFSDAALEALLDSAREFNRGAGITGFLAYDPHEGENGTFVQRLEGPERAVLDVFETRVLGSSRHTDIEVKMKAPIGKREFADWSMAYDSGWRIPPTSPIRISRNSLA